MNSSMDTATFSPGRHAGALAPLRRTRLSCLGGRAVAVALAVGSGLYLLNPTMGLFELLPDNLPLVGNLDEAAMVTMLLGCLRALRRQRAERLELAAST